MLIEISGERTGSIVMFGNAAKSLLKMMGQSGQPEGALREEDVSGALESLHAALKTMPDDSATNSDEDDDHVSLRTRAVPLIKLLEECVEKGGYLMWKPQ